MTMTIENTIDKALNGTARERTAAFNQIFNEFHPRIVIFIKRRFGAQLTTEEVEDAALETMTRAMEPTVLGKWKPNFQFFTWLVKIANNKSIDALRKKEGKDNVTTVLSELESKFMNEHDYGSKEVVLTVDRSNPEILMINDELKEQIVNAFEKLSPKNKETAKYYFIDQLNDEEVEAITGINPSTYRCRVSRLKVKLQEILSEEGVLA